MDRTAKVVLTPLGLLHLPRVASISARSLSLLICGALIFFGAINLPAQQSDGGIQGTITDPAGKVIVKAKVTAINDETGIMLTRYTNETGGYSITPLQVGHYQVIVEAKGFEKLVQQAVSVDALQILGLNLKMTVGSDTMSVVVTEAPAQLNTTEADLGLTVENELYTELPLSMGGAPRDPTAFAFLTPGVQEGGGNTGVFGGSGQEYLNENYVEGIPQSTIATQGDPTVIRNSLSVDAVDQFQVKTNGASTGFGGVGVTNFTIKSGGNKMHGTIFDYVRNTAFDTWGYFSKVPQATGYAVKPAEHQNSFGGSLGGPLIKDKLFYFVTYEGYLYTKVSNTPEYLTVPTLQERQGNFTDYFGDQQATYGSGNYGIFDPTVSTARQQFRGLLNGAPTYNVIPQNEISSISQYMASALPAPTNTSTYNNYLAGLPLENRNYTVDARLDYSINESHKLSIVGLGGVKGYGHEPNYTTQYQLGFPYAGGDFTNQRTSTGVVTHTWVITQNKINSLKYGYSRTWGDSFAPSDGTKFAASKIGIGNLPSGNASNTFPGVTFSGGYTSSEPGLTSWGGNTDSGPRATNNYTIIDNLTWMKGRHNMTFGLQLQWLETNAASYAGYSGNLALTYSADNTADNTNAVGGSDYASFLVGAVYTGNERTQTIVDSGGRYRPMAPYFQDSWRLSSKMTVNLGLRYDYLQPYREAKDRIAWVDGTTINPLVGIPGVIKYGGFGSGPNPSFADYVCQCHTPVKTYYKNIEPRVGFAYSVHQNTVIRANFGVMTTHAGGTGGHANATFGPGNNAEFAQTQVWASESSACNSSTCPPAFFLNPSMPSSASPGGPYVTGVTNQNGQLIGQSDYSSIPQWTGAGVVVNPLSTTGNYQLTAANTPDCPLSSQGSNGYCNAGTQTYIDPHYGGHGPQFVNYNFGIQQMINRNAVLSIDYAGSQTHYLPGGAGRGYAQNTISPDYGAALGGVLTDQAASINNATLQQIQAVLPSYHLPYPGFGGANASVFRALSAFPQYNAFTDVWGATGNASYNALQVQLVQRPWHGISGFVNYTWSKSMDDTHNHRTQYPVGPQDGNFPHTIGANRVDRSLGTFDQRQGFNATWVIQFPFGRGRAFLAKDRLPSALLGGWSLSGIFKIRDGSPLQITETYECPYTQYGGQGSCMPEYVPGFAASKARINGKWGRAPGANATNIQNISYLNTAAFQQNGTYSGSTNAGYLLGNVPSSAPYGLTGPGWKDLDTGLRRTFTIREGLTFQVEADVINTLNSTYFVLATNATKWGTCTAGQNIQQCPAAAFGTIGGQTTSVPPRDWQFSGRFRF